MMQMDWNEFVDTHKTGHGIGIRSLLKLRPLDADGKKPAAVRSVLLKAVAAAVEDDWSVMSLPSKAKVGGKTVAGTVYNFIFKSMDDQAAAMQAIGAQSHQTAPRPIKPFATYQSLGDLMPVGYDRMAAAISKSQKPKTP
jgi:hypothetical protein